MLGSRLLLVLFGTSLASAHVLRNGKLCHKHAPALPVKVIVSKNNITELMPPFLSHFFPQSSNLFYKPHISLSPSHMPMPVVTEVKKKDCRENKPEPPKVIIEEQIPIENKPLFIPQTPELPPLTMPEAPIVVFEDPNTPAELPVIPEEPIVDIRPAAIPIISEPIGIPEAPEWKPVEISVVPDQKPADNPTIPEWKPLEIPEAPVLPPFVMPEIPETILAEEPKIPAPCQHEVRNDIQPESVRFVFPEAPKLPELAIPIPIVPELEPPVIPEIPLPSPIQEIDISEREPIVIPKAPELPPFAMPELPTIVFEKPSPVPTIAEPSLPCQPAVSKAPIEEEHDYIKPVHIPPAPELPPITLPEIPVVPIPPEPVEELPTLTSPDIPVVAIPPEPVEELPILTSPDIPVVAIPPEPVEEHPAVFEEEPVEIIEIRPVTVPEAPELPSFVVPSLPEHVLTEESCEDDESVDVKPAVVFETVSPQSWPAQLPFPIFYAQNIIIERILPNLILNEEKRKRSVDLKLNDE